MPSVGDPAGESAVLDIAGESTGESAGDTFGFEIGDTVLNATTVAVLARLTPTETGAIVALTGDEFGGTGFPIGALEVIPAVGDPTGESAVLVIDEEITGETVSDKVGLDAGGIVPEATTVGVLTGPAPTETGAIVAPIVDDAGDLVDKGELVAIPTGATAEAAKVVTGDVVSIGEMTVIFSRAIVVGTIVENSVVAGKFTASFAVPCLIADDDIGGADAPDESELKAPLESKGIGDPVGNEFGDVVSDPAGDEAGDDAEKLASELSTIAFIDGGIDGVVFCCATDESVESRMAKGAVEVSGEDGAAEIPAAGGAFEVLTGVLVGKAEDEVSESGAIGMLVEIFSCSSQ